MNGIILINKGKDYTSRDIVNVIGKELHTKKVGHTGTLDPLATGVLAICVGEATKIAELLTSTYKEYIAEIKLGIKTDTLDITGNILEEKKDSITKEQLEKVLKKMTKTYLQEVPIYSAVKVNGRKLYEYARNNEEVILPKKEVTIQELELLEYSEDKFKIRCLVSKGTYIRSLINDLCDELNVIGTMSNLVRTKQGKFDIKDTNTLEDIKNNNYKLISIENVLDLPKVEADDYLESRIKNGSILENRYDSDIIMFTNKNNKILAIYKVYERDNTKVKPWKMFNNLTF